MTRRRRGCYSPPHDARERSGPNINPEAWYALVSGQRRGVFATAARAALRSASLPYALAARGRNTLYDRGWKTVRPAAVPVVSVGNLSLGGTGKTPCVEWVARFFRARDVQVAILSRGYGSKAGRNDEALVLEDNLPDVPHYQGPDRAALAATAVVESESELLVLDDGFQHRRLARDLDLVLIDATRPPTRDHVFPRGTLREPVGGLRRANAVLLTRCDQVPAAELDALRAWVSRIAPGVPVAATEHRPTELIGGAEPEPIDRLRGTKVGAFCGIGNPGAFRRTLEGLGATVAEMRTFPDHHAYTRADVDDLARWAEGLPPGAVLATTQKDWVKLRVAELGGRPLRAVRVGLYVRDGEHALASLLGRVLPRSSGE